MHDFLLSLGTSDPVELPATPLEHCRLDEDAGRLERSRIRAGILDHLRAKHEGENRHTHQGKYEPDEHHLFPFFLEAGIFQPLL